MDKYSNKRTVHGRNDDSHDFGYNVKSMLFRTKVIQDSILEFRVEKSYPLELPSGDKSPGVGKTIISKI